MSALGLRFLLLGLIFAWLPGAALAERDPLLPRDRTLGSGLSLRVLEDHALPLVSVLLMVPAGNIHDPQGRGGTAMLAGRLLSEGTEQRSALELATALEGLGAEVDVDPGATFTTISTSFLARDLPAGLELLAELVSGPRFDPDDLERERQRALAGLAENRAYAPYLASRAVYSTLYGEHPYGLPESGTESSLAAITVDDLRAFHQARYRPRGSVLCIAGDVKPRELARVAEHAFRGWRGRAAAHKPAPLPPSWTGTRLVMVDLPDQTQVQLRLAHRTIHRSHDDFQALRMANAVVGGGFTSRLMEEIRVERSLSYGASSHVYSFLDEAVFQARTFTRNETAREALDVAWQVLAGWRGQGWEDDEYERARSYALGMLPQVLETRMSRAWNLALMSFYDLPADDMATRAGRIASIPRLAAQQAAAQHLPADGWLVVVVGDLDLVRLQLEDFQGGQWEVVEVD